MELLINSSLLDSARFIGGSGLRGYLRPMIQL